MSDAFKEELKSRDYECETHIIEARLLFPDITSEIESQILALCQGDYENSTPVDTNFKTVKALMEFLAGFPLEAFTTSERLQYINCLREFFSINNGNFLKICSQIILAHPPTVDPIFARIFKELHGDILGDNEWDEIISTYQKIHKQALEEVRQGSYNQAEDRLSKALKRLDLCQRNPLVDQKIIQKGLSQGYQLLAEIFMHKKLYHQATSVAWFAKRVDSSFKTPVDLQIETIEQAFLSTLTKNPTIKGLKQATQDRIKLEEIRSQIKEELDKLPKQDKIPHLKQLYQKITHQMKEFLASLLEDTEDNLKSMGFSPPCSYVVMGLGSLARQEMTPYSDLEFAILTEKDLADKSYFRHLTLLFHLRIINLGETIVPSLAIDSLNWLFDNQTPRGLAFDGNMSTASKTPYGKQRGGKGDYELIGPISHFLTFQGNWTEDSDGGLWAAKRYHLPLVLSNATLIRGDSHLFENYQNELHEKPRLSFSLSVLEEDLQMFDPHLEEEVSGKTYNVKKDLYRLPTTMLDSLANHFKLSSQSSWERIEELHKRGIFSSQGADDLLNLLMLTQELRLRTYLSYGSQNDDLSPEISPELYSFYYVALPFVQTMKQFYQATQNLEEDGCKYLQKDCFFDDSLFCQGCVGRRLLDYLGAEKNLEVDPRDTIVYYETLADIKTALYKLDEAQISYEKLLKKIPPEDKELNATIWIKRAEVYQKQTLYAQAQEAVKQAEDVLSDQASPILEKAKRLRASFNLKRSDYKKAEQELTALLAHINKRLSKQKKDPKYGVKVDLSLAETLTLLAQTYKELFQFPKAEKTLQQAFDIFRAYYQNSEHPKLAKIHLLFGSLFEAQGRSKEALARGEQALAIFLSLFKCDHPDIATSYNNIGLSLGELNKHKEAMKKYHQALDMYINLFGENHPDVATSYNNIGLCLEKLGDYAEALNHHKKALKIFKTFLRKENHPDIADCYDNIGLSLSKQGDHEKALENKRKALDIRLPILGNQHTDVGLSFNNVGRSLDELDEHQKALEYYEKALAIFIDKFGEDHPRVADVYHNMGRSLLKLKKSEQALEKQKQVLRIRLKFEDPASPKMTDCYSSMGSCLLKLKRYQEALEQYQKALDIRIKEPGADIEDLSKKIKHCEKKLAH